LNYTTIYIKLYRQYRHQGTFLRKKRSRKKAISASGQTFFRKETLMKENNFGIGTYYSKNKQYLPKNKQILAKNKPEKPPFSQNQPYSTFSIAKSICPSTYNPRLKSNNFH